MYNEHKILYENELNEVNSNNADIKMKNLYASTGNEKIKSE